MTINQTRGEINPIPVAAQKLPIEVEVIVFPKRCHYCKNVLEYVKRDYDVWRCGGYYTCKTSWCPEDQLPPPHRRYPKETR